MRVAWPVLIVLVFLISLGRAYSAEPHDGPAQARRVAEGPPATVAQAATEEPPDRRPPRALPRGLSIADIPESAPDKVRELLRQTFSVDPESRGAAATQLGQFSSEATLVFPFLVRLLIDGEYFGNAAEHQAVGTAASAALVQLGEPVTDLCEQFVDTYLGTKIGSRVIGVLARRPDAKATRVLWKLFENEDPEVRTWVVVGLFERSVQADRVPILLTALRDDSVDVRLRAVHVLVHVQDDSCVPPLIASLGDADLTVRQFAAWALGNYYDARVADALQRTLMNKAEMVEVRYYVAQSYGRIATKIQMDPLYGIALDRQNDRDTRTCAIAAFWHSKDARARETLLALLARPDEPAEIYYDAVAALAKSAGKDACPHLMQVIQDGTRHSVVRSCAAAFVVSFMEGAVSNLSVVEALRALPTFRDHGSPFIDDGHDVRKKALVAIAANGTTQEARDAAAEQHFAVTGRRIR